MTMASDIDLAFAQGRRAVHGAETPDVRAGMLGECRA